jgi:hypothetical protein
MKNFAAWDSFSKPLEFNAEFLATPPTNEMRDIGRVR